MNNNERGVLILHTCEALGPISIKRMLEAYGGGAAALEAALGEGFLPPLTIKQNQALKKHLRSFDLEKFLVELERFEVRMVFLGGDDYPALLREIHDAPHVLFIRGETPDWSRTSLAVVGTRHASEYGLRAAEYLVGPVAAAGVRIISGLAYGIDSAAHRAAVRGGGQTVAVVARGHARATAREHQEEKHILESGGAIISEWWPNKSANRAAFPMRNRLIAGLSAATLVIEGQIKSGTMITARAAISENREVLAVPGSIFAPTAEGPNYLIQSGAHPVTSPDDILDILGIAKNQSLFPATAHQKLDPEQNKILELLANGPADPEILTQKIGLSIGPIISHLVSLEALGLIEPIGGNRYRRLEK